MYKRFPVLSLPASGLPDTYGRGRIVGDYRRVALYGIDQLIAWKEEDKANCGDGNMFDDVIRQREELSEQIKRLKEMKVMAQSYGYDISKPASNAKEAVQSIKIDARITISILSAQFHKLIHPGKFQMSVLQSFRRHFMRGCSNVHEQIYEGLS